MAPIAWTAPRTAQPPIVLHRAMPGVSPRFEHHTPSRVKVWSSTLLPPMPRPLTTQPSVAASLRIIRVDLQCFRHICLCCGADCKLLLSDNAGRAGPDGEAKTTARG